MKKVTREESIAAMEKLGIHAAFPHYGTFLDESEIDQIKCRGMDCMHGMGLFTSGHCAGSGDPFLIDCRKFEGAPK